MILGPEQITDGGPWYAETHVTDALIVEPWNAISSLAIAAPAVYFLWKIRKQPKDYSFLLAAIPFLFLNGLGSTLFHGVRTSRWLLYMDFIPAMILTLLITIYFWSKVLPKKWMSFVLVVPVFLMRFTALNLIGGQSGLNVSYAISGLAFLVPIFLILRKNNWEKTYSIVLGSVCFVLAIYFRQADHYYTSIIPIGTHFLWHIFSGIGAYFLANYLYFIRTKELKKKHLKVD
mgnify:FL=1